MITESFTDEYGTTVTMRQLDDWTHVQLLMHLIDGTEDVSYGFTPEDFAKFAAAASAVSARVSA